MNANKTPFLFPLKQASQGFFLHCKSSLRLISCSLTSSSLFPFKVILITFTSISLSLHILISSLKSHYFDSIWCKKKVPLLHPVFDLLNYTKWKGSFMLFPRKNDTCMNSFLEWCARVSSKESKRHHHHYYDESGNF